MLTLQDALKNISGKTELNIMTLRAKVVQECPMTVKALRVIDYEYTLPRQLKGYNLVKRENKKLGFVYYVRYGHEGRMLPSKWCTHTNNFEQATRFAIENRDYLISKYLDSSGSNIMRFFKTFFDEKSPIYRPRRHDYR
jgi:hypothetical protein